MTSGNEKILTGHILHLTTFYFGFASAIAQVLLIRELLTLFRGNEFIIGIIFSAWFLGIYLGARFNPEADVILLTRRIERSIILFPAILFIMIYITHLTPLIIHLTPGSFYSISTEMVLSLAFTVPVSLFSGYVFPPLVSLSSQSDGKQSGGLIYSIEAMGSFTGGVLFSFILVDMLNPAGVISLLMALSVFLLYVLRGKKIILLLLPMLVIMLIFSEKAETMFFRYIWGRTHTGILSEYSRTRHQAVAVESSQGTTAIYGDGVFYHSLPDRYEARSVFHLVQSLKNKADAEILLFGSGQGSLLHNLLNTDISELTYVETDRELLKIENQYRQKYYKKKDECRKPRLIDSDLRHYLAQTDKMYDMIICLPPPPENARLNRFYTREFYSMCAKHIKPDGIFLTAIHGFSNYMGRDMLEYIASVYKSLIMEFPYNLYSSGEIIYLIAAKQKNVLPANQDILINNYRKKPAGTGGYKLEKEITDNYNPDEIRMLFEQTQLDYFRERMKETLPRIEENTDLKPKAYWNRILLSALEEQSVIYTAVKNGYIIQLACVILIIIFFLDAYKKYGGTAFNAGFIMFTVGFVSISTMLVLIILYQNFYGIVYYRIALINAVFMLGLTAGSYYANKYFYKRPVIIFFLIILVLVSILIFPHIRSEIIYWIIIPAFSFLCGSVFPVLFNSAPGKNYHKKASMLDAMDHFGSIAGSMLTGIFLVPALGITGAIMCNIAILLMAAGISMTGNNAYAE